MLPLSLHTFELVVAILISGCAAGFIAGLFGVGGGILTVPVLYTVFVLNNVSPDSAMHAAVGTSLLTILPTSVASFRSHWAHHAVDPIILRRWAPLVMSGAVLGSGITHQIAGTWVTLIFAIFAFFIAAYMGFGKPPETTSLTMKHGPIQKLIAFGIGVVSSLVGVGGGALTVPTLVASDIPVHRAVGTASAIGFLVSLPAVLVLMLWPSPEGSMPPYSFGQVNLLAFALLAPSTMLMAPRGARLAHRLKATGLRKAFALLLAVIAIKMMVSALK